MPRPAPPQFVPRLRRPAAAERADRTPIRLTGRRKAEAEARKPKGAA